MRKISLGVCCGTLLIASLVGTGCSRFRHSNEQIFINMRDDPRSLDPREVRLLSNINLIKHIYEGLVQENTSTGEIEPALAESYSLSNDGMRYTFRLRQTQWSNGDPLTAEDFIDSWKQVVRREVGGIYLFAFDPIQNVKKATQNECSLDEVGFYAEDSRTLVITLDSPTSHFLKLLSLPIFFPVHRQQREGKDSLPVTNGAFYLKKFKAKQWMHLEKNPYYYNHDQVNSQAIVVHFIPDANTAALLFNQGKLHWQGPPWGERIPTEALAYLKSQGNLLTFEVAETSWITFNINKFPFSYPKLRKALALALDKHALVSAAFLNRVQPAIHLLPTNIHTYPVPDRPPQEYNRNLAKKLFMEAIQELDITSKDLENYTLTFPSSSVAHALLVQLIREQWKDVLGFTISIAGKEFPVMQQELTSGQFSLAMGEWFADFSDPMAFLSIFSYPSGIPPYSINHESFLALLKTIQHECNRQKRSELISQAALYLESLHIIEPIYHDAFHVALNKKFANVRLSPTGIVDFRYINSP